MADSDVQITAGSGTKIDTRTVGAGADEHRQVVVIGDPTTAGNVALVDATFGLEVDVSRVIPGTGGTNLGKAEDTAHADGDVGVLFLGVRNHFSGSTTDGDYSAVSVSSYGDMHTIGRKDQLRLTSGTITTNTSSHTAGQQTGGVVTLASAARVSGGTGVITAVVLTDVDDVIGPFDVAFFRSSPTTGGDNTTLSFADGDMANLVGLVQLTGAFDLGGNRVAQAHNISVPYDCAATSLFAVLVTRFTYTPTTTTALNLQVTVERN